MPKTPVRPRFQRKHLARPEEPTNAMSENLQKIYANSDGSMPDMRTFTPRRGRPLLAAVLVLAMVGVGVFTAYSRGLLHGETADQATIEGAELVINGPEQVTIGETVTYQIVATNNDSGPFTKTQLQVRWPANFVIEKSEPNATAEGNWPLGALAEGRSQTITVSGKFWGDIGSEQSVRAFLNYTPSNFSSEFQAVAVRAVRLQNAPVTVVVSAPASVSPGNPATYTFTINAVSCTWPNVALSVEPGFDFSKKDASPARRFFTRPLRLQILKCH